MLRILKVVELDRFSQSLCRLKHAMEVDGEIVVQLRWRREDMTVASSDKREASPSLFTKLVVPLQTQPMDIGGDEKSSPAMLGVLRVT